MPNDSDISLNQTPHPLDEFISRIEEIDRRFDVPTLTSDQLVQIANDKMKLADDSALEVIKNSGTEKEAIMRSKYHYLDTQIGRHIRRQIYTTQNKYQNK